MKNRIHIQSLIVGVVLGIVVVFSVGAATGGINRTTWEHKVVVHQNGKALQEGLEEPLDAASREGWEAVGLGNNATQPFVLMRRAKRTELPRGPGN
jgi:hypothetical protein